MLNLAQKLTKVKYNVENLAYNWIHNQLITPKLGNGKLKFNTNFNQVITQELSNTIIIIIKLQLE